MQLVEQHVVSKSDPRFATIDQAPFASKNLYNQANYQIRQAFIQEGKYLPYAAIFHRLKHHEAYCALPRKVSNSILIQLHQNWIAFFKEMDAYREDPSKFLGRPNIPGYKDKEKGRNILIYDKQAIGKRVFKMTGEIVPSGLGIEIETEVSWEALDQVRIIPRGSCYVVEVVYQKAEQPAPVDPKVIAAIDLLIAEGIGTLVIGKNRLWKQEVEMGKKNNQQFVQIPHARFIDLLTYKAQLVGINVLVQEESYTSKASFLDLDPIPTYDPNRKEKPLFSGKRESRGLYRAKNDRRVQADVNGSYNTLRKAFPNAFPESLLGEQGIVGPAVAPCRLVDKSREDTGSSVSMSRLNG
jgi:IS605 OrfB family transposase